MASEIAGQPHWEIGFDEHGKADQGEVDALLAELPGKDLTDLFVFSHGWNNDRRQARRLYQLYFQQVPGLLGGGGQAARVGTLGVVWPSKRWADEPEPTGDGDGDGGAAGLGDAAAATAAPADTALVEDLKDVFEGDQQRQALDELARLLEERPEDPAALARFQTLMGSWPARPTPRRPARTRASWPCSRTTPRRCSAASPTPSPDRRGRRGRHRRRLRAAVGRAKEALRQLTYFEMKKRAGVVGKQGLGPLLGRIHQADPELRIHLLGTASGPGWSPSPWPACPTAPAPRSSRCTCSRARSRTSPSPTPCPWTARGAAPSRAWPPGSTAPWWPRSRSTTWPSASSTRWPRSAPGTTPAGLEDRLFRWGGIGHDGAQAVDATVAALGPVGTGYPFQKGRFVNLDGNAIVNRGGPPSGAHSDIFHPELVWAGLAAAGLVRAT